MISIPGIYRFVKALIFYLPPAMADSYGIFKPARSFEQGRLVTHIHFTCLSLSSKLLPSFEWALTGVASSDAMTLTSFPYPSQQPSMECSQTL